MVAIVLIVVRFYDGNRSCCCSLYADFVGEFYCYFNGVVSGRFSFGYL